LNKDIKKKPVKKEHKLAKSTVPGKKRGKKKSRNPKTADRILEEKIKNPHLTQQEIADKLESTRGYVSQALTSDRAKMIFEESEKRLTQKLVTIREKAMDVLQDAVNGHGFVIDPATSEIKMFIYPPQVRLAAVKFALEQFMIKTGEPIPTEIIFETFISEMGIEQKQTKVYGKSGDSHDEI